MSVSDFKVNADVRRILNKRWISLKQLRFSCTGGIVYMRGSLEMMYNAPTGGKNWQGLTGEHIGNLERAIKKIPNVKRVNFQLNNWKKMSDGWTRIDHQ